MAENVSQLIGALYASVTLDTGGFGTSVNKVMTDLKSVNSGLEATGQKSDAAAAALNKTGQAVKQYGDQTKAASGQTANLVSQFNDIAVMLAAGQNPLQLAMQQGTQISQVLTGMGGGVGALKALGGAFIGMLNPISLATIGVIGFGAAAFQWLMPAKEEAKKTKDAFESLKESMTGYNDAYGISLLYTGDAEEKYGAEAQRGAEIARKIMELEAKKTQQSISSILSKAYSELGFDAFGDRGIKDDGRIASANLAEVAGNLGFEASWGDTLFGYGGVSEEALQSVERLGNNMREIYDYVSKPIEGGLDDYLAGLRNRIEAYTAELNALKEAGASEASIEAYEAKIVPLQQQLLEAERQRADIRAADEAKGQEMLATLEQQLAMNQLIAEHGADSLEVRQAELDAEHAKQTAAIESLNITDQQKDALFAQLDALHSNESQTLAWAAAMAQVNAELQASYSLISSIAGGMIVNAKINAAKKVRESGGSAIEARRAGEMAGRRQEILNGVNTHGSQYFGWTDAEVNTALDQLQIDADAADTYRGLTTEAPRGRGGSGRRGGSRGSSGGGRERKTDAQRDAEREAKRQSEAYKDLNERLAMLRDTFGQTELAQKIYTEQQKIGTAATAEDVAEKVKLIDTIEKIQKAMDQAKDIFSTAFQSIITGAESARDVLAGVLDDMASRMAKIAGDALFDSLFGGLIKGVAGGIGGTTGVTSGASSIAASVVKLPGYANGTDGKPGSGWAIVGERGAEAVWMNAGSRVMNADKTARMLGGDGSNGTNGHLKVSLADGLKAEWIAEAGSNSAQISRVAIKQNNKVGVHNRFNTMQQNPWRKG